MPGIYGVVAPDKDTEYIVETLDRMANYMDHNGKSLNDSFVDQASKVGAGRIHLGVFDHPVQPVQSKDNTCQLIFHGELYGNNSGMSDPDFILSRFSELGDSCAVGLNGIFHFIVFNRASGELKIFNDKFGLQPVYFSKLPAGVVFGAEVKALLADTRIDKKPDYHSFGDFLHYGQILGDKTLFENIKLLKPASVLTIDLDSGKTSQKKYWHLDTLFALDGQYDFNASPDQTVNLLVNSIRKNAGNKNLLGLSLSGGLDSRGILAGLHGHTRGLNTYTLGLTGCADQKLAARMAEEAKTEHAFIELGHAYLSDFEVMANDMITLSDGMYHPHESTEMLALNYFKKADFKILLRGHGGEIAKAALAYPVMVRPEVSELKSENDILDYIYNISNLVKRDVDCDKLFTGAFREIMKEAPRKSLSESCGRVAGRLSPADVCIYYYINEHIRRQVVSSLDIFRSEVEIRMPYVDEAYLKSLFQLPVKERNSGEIHYKLIKKCMPGLVKIPNSNTGAPLDAGPLRLFITDKFNSLMKRFGVTGFRHYTEFQKWHRDVFRENSKKIIFSDRAKERRIYNMNYLHKIFDLHVAGNKDYGHLLGTIAGLELWFENFVD